MKKIIAVVAVLGLSACSGNVGTKEAVGTGAGAIAGGVIGSMFGSGTGKLIGVGVGTLAGALLGNELGKSLDRADQAYANQAIQRSYSAPVGQGITWNNPNSGNSGTVVATREGYASNGQPCREYSHTVVIGNRQEQAYGTACRQADGSWRVIQ